MGRSTQSRNPAPVAEQDAPKTDAAAPATPTQVRTCECGCGVAVARRFKPGHDGRLKGQLIRTIRAARQLADAKAEDAAIQRMAKLGWAKFVPEAPADPHV